MVFEKEFAFVTHSIPFNLCGRSPALLTFLTPYNECCDPAYLLAFILQKKEGTSEKSSLQIDRRGGQGQPP